VWAALADGAASRDLYPDFSLDDDAGLLFCHVVGGDGLADKNRICVPTVARKEVLKEMHDVPSSGQGVHSTLHRHPRRPTGGGRQ
jgi:hypothetical protein